MWIVLALLLVAAHAALTVATRPHTPAGKVW